jgi:hypothetical protein
MLAFIFLPAILGNSHCLVLFLLINSPSAQCAYSVNVVHKHPDIFAAGITFILINLKLLMLSVPNPNVLCYVILVTSHFCLFVCLFAFLH